MAAEMRMSKPNMAALDGPMGRSIFETIRDAPEPDWDRIEAQSKALEKRIVEALKNAKA